MSTWLNRLRALVPIYTVLTLIFLFSCKPSIEKYSLDFDNDSIQVQKLVQQADLIAETHPDSALIIYHKVLITTEEWIKATSVEKKLYPWMLKHNALASRGIGVVYTNKGDFQPALEMINKAIETVHKYEELSVDDFKSDIVAVLNSKGVIQKKFGHFKEALETYQYAARIAEKQNDLPSKAIFLTNTGNIYQEIGELDKAMEYILEAIDLHSKLNNERGVAVSSLTLANILNSQKKYEEARPFYLKALTFCSTQNLIGPTGLIQSNLGVLEHRLHNFTVAREYFNKALINLEKAGNKQGLALVYGNIANLANDMGNFSEAIVFANKQLEEALASQALVNQRYAYKHLSKAYASTGNFKKAYENHLNYTQINDSILSVEKQNEISRLEAVFQDEKKKEEINYLANLSSELKKQNRTKNYLLISLLLLLLTSILLAATWIITSKINAHRKQLSLEHKLLRSQMNPHFLFNSLSAIQNMVLRVGKMEAAGLVANFAKFIRFILDSSRENLIPLDKEIEAINLYLDLQKVRFPNLFKNEFIIDIEDDPSDVLIPPLIFQPFVENSVIHGFPKDRVDNLLTIHIFQCNGTLCCRIKDNGIGFDTSKSSKEGTHKSLATQITLERLSILEKKHRSKASFAYEQLPDNEKGTSILIKIPLLFSDVEKN